MEKITVRTSKIYEIQIGRNLLKDAGKYIAQVIKPGKACLISDRTVWMHYGELIQKVLEKEGFEVIIYLFPPGENSKNIATVMEILELMAAKNFTRTDSIVALGGGITGDIAGFAASIFLRGIKYVQIPTTFLAAADSSAGGKTGINLAGGKNLAGAFWQPALVLCDCDTLQTLPYEIFLDGVAEAIKYGMILEEKLFHLLVSKGKELYTQAVEGEQAGERDSLPEIIKWCVNIKCRIVEEDERDTGMRQLLNFGHTLGHAIETCSNYKITHGHSVALGMLMMCRAADRLGFSKEETASEMEAVLHRFQFPLDCSFSVKELTEAALKDKKRDGETIVLVMPKRVGECYLKKIPVSRLEEVIRAGWSAK